MNDSEMLLVLRMISVDIYFPEIYFILIGLSHRGESISTVVSKFAYCTCLWSGIYRVTMGRCISFVVSRRVDSDFLALFQ